MIEMERQLDYMPPDKRFYIGNGQTELCHSTGKEVLIDGEWWFEYKDREGNTYYGR